MKHDRSLRNKTETFVRAAQVPVREIVVKRTAKLLTARTHPWNAEQMEE